MGLEYSVEKIEERDLGVLKIKGELDVAVRKDFLVALGELMNTESSKVVIDLSRINSMSSLFIGSLVDFGGKVKAAGRTVAVMAKPKVVQVCKMIGLHDVVQLIEV